MVFDRKGIPLPLFSLAAYVSSSDGVFCSKPKARNRVALLNVAFRFFKGELIIFVVGFILNFRNNFTAIAACLVRGDKYSR